jgi:hypothetical protein
MFRNPGRTAGDRTGRLHSPAGSGFPMEIDAAMPDWSYRTLFRPVLFRLPGTAGRDLAVAAIGGLGRLPGGRRVIEFMGHMRPPRSLRRRLGGLELDSPVGLAPGIDPQLVGLPGMCRFGFGFVEVGPVTARGVPERRTARDDGAETIGIEPSATNPGAATVGRILAELPAPRPAVIVRLADAATEDDDARVCAALAGHAAAWSLPVPSGPAAAGWRWPSPAPASSCPTTRRCRG